MDTDAGGGAQPAAAQTAILRTATHRETAWALAVLGRTSPPTAGQLLLVLVDVGMAEPSDLCGAVLIDMTEESWYVRAARTLGAPNTTDALTAQLVTAATAAGASRLVLTDGAVIEL